MKDEIGQFIDDGEPAGNFAPHVKVWSEMAVRVIVLRALQSAQQNMHLTAGTVRQNGGSKRKTATTKKAGSPSRK